MTLVGVGVGVGDGVNSGLSSSIEVETECDFSVAIPLLHHQQGGSQSRIRLKITERDLGAVGQRRVNMDGNVVRCRVDKLSLNLIKEMLV